MSAVSPQFVQNDSTDRNHDPELSNLYLSAAVDPEEAEFKSSGIRLTPVEDRGSAWNGSASPLEHSGNNASTPDNNEDYGTSYTEFLSPADDWTSDMSGHTSPADIMMPGVWMTNAPPSQNIQTPAPNQFTVDPSSSQATMNPSQLLTPNLTNNPSPSSDTTSVGSHRVPRSHHPPIPRLITTPLTDTLGPRPAPEPINTISPIVKVESYSRGDSPVRDSFSTNRHPSQSSVHLSPGGLSNASEDDVTMETDRHSVSRSDDGAWVPNGLTGQSGLAPDAREDVYVLSPNEMDSQRMLAEKNVDIYNWSEAVSEAHSESGDDYLPRQRGRTDNHGTRRRAKSTGDPSLHQQDYFNLKSHHHRLEVPGPGLVLQETSDYSDDATESSAPVSVNEERWAQEASEITPPEPQNTETDEPQPHQFLGSPPWRDIELDSSPRTTQIQPGSSTQAMVEFQRRAREYDALSRVATWGTRDRDLDANSIRSFQKMNLNGKEKKHERRSSLLKYFPQKKGNLLKRQRQKSDLSTIQPVPEGDSVDAESKPAPQRKDSFPHRKLSLGLSPKSPSYSIGGAVMATTRQMAAIGGKDSLNVVSPSSTTKSWNSFKPRGRSRSEVPTAPGLFELMTSHGGPPVPNINYSAQPTEDEGVKRVDPDNDAAEDDDDDNDDEKGFVMDFPIPPNLPVPTLEGFRTQILQLNPRLEPALVDRFAHEQVRRYKRLIEIKQTHARDVNSGKCKAGKSCLALGGKAKLLPPRASAQDADSHTQFQIPGRGETEEHPEALGETTIAIAQFPPGVPHPPPQVQLLPAEFECMVCFHVKKFQKPSDWTKHIYEDVQPFTCTFPDCADPKSFKRKADWVRHENERHRHLEWWECSFTDCRHRCYRKDNFVQHLIREHKLPEPKAKRWKNKGSSGCAPNDPITPEMQEEINRDREIHRLWNLVDSCRHDTTKRPKEEACRFCGNVCTNWKKLTVHLAKHMEQMAIPILGLVDEREFPYNNGTYSTGNTDTCSVQVPATQNTSDFAPRLNNGVAEGLDTSMNFTQAQYPGGHTGGSESLAIPFTTSAPYLPAASMSMEDTSPNQLNNFQGVSPYATHNGGMSGPTALAEEQTRLVGMQQHQNSVTYPPPFNTGPRPRVSNQDLRVLPEYNNFSMSPTEMQYDPHSAVYVSSGAENHYTYHGPMASAMPYNPGAYQGQGQ
ncbi:hypothetical protein BDW62DRAFT_169329 [Aspergillus aurantiobrunneus]